jgi:hypothetical protein
MKTIVSAMQSCETSDNASSLSPRYQPCHLGPGIFFTEACSFLRLFRHNFAENGPQDLKMV